LYMVANGNFKSRFAKLYSYLKVIVVTGNVSAYQDFSDAQMGAHFAFSIAIIAGWGIYMAETVYFWFAFH